MGWLWSVEGSAQAEAGRHTTTPTASKESGATTRKATARLCIASTASSDTRVQTAAMRTLQRSRPTQTGRHCTRRLQATAAAFRHGDGSLQHPRRPGPAHAAQERLSDSERFEQQAPAPRPIQTGRRCTRKPLTAILPVIADRSRSAKAEEEEPAIDAGRCGLRGSCRDAERSRPAHAAAGQVRREWPGLAHTDGTAAGHAPGRRRLRCQEPSGAFVEL